MLTEKDKQDIAEMVVARLREGLQCACGLPDDALQEMPHLFGMFRDIGEGDRAKGIERVRRSIMIVDKLAGTGERVGLAIVIFVCVTLTGGLLTALSIGLKWFFGQPQGGK